MFANGVRSSKALSRVPTTSSPTRSNQLVRRVWKLYWLRAPKFCSKPVGPFPSITLTKSSIQVFMPIVNPAGFGGLAAGLSSNRNDDEDMLVGFFVFALMKSGLIERHCNVCHPKHINTRMALDDPFCKKFPGTSCCGDAETDTF